MSSGTDLSQQLAARSNGGNSTNQDDAPLAAMVAKVSNVFKGVRNATKFGRDNRGESSSGTPDTGKPVSLRVASSVGPPQHESSQL